MRAIDTNVVVRFLTNDDADQAAAARTAIEQGDIFIGTTVLLESEWVLRSAYGFGSEAIAAGLRGLAGLPQVTIEAPGLLVRALGWMEAGMDFADALHLAGADACTAFLSFDGKLARAAAAAFTTVPVERP